MQIGTHVEHDIISIYQGGSCIGPKLYLKIVRVSYCRQKRIDTNMPSFIFPDEGVVLLSLPKMRRSVGLGRARAALGTALPLK